MDIWKSLFQLLGSASANDVVGPALVVSPRGTQPITRTDTVSTRVWPTARLSIRHSNVVEVNVHPLPPTYWVPGCTPPASSVTQGSGEGP
jgi:hypothetical protein